MGGASLLVGGGSASTAPARRLIQRHLSDRLLDMAPTDIISDNYDAWCLADPAGKTVFVYSQTGEGFKIDLSRYASTSYRAIWHDPRTGDESPAELTFQGKVASAKTPDTKDWALLLEQNGN